MSDRRLRARDDSGLTLVELIVAVMLLSILLALVANLYVSTMRTVGLSRELTANTKQVANAMNETTRAIRAATENPVSGSALNQPAFIIARPDDIVFFAYVNVYSDLTSAQQPVMIRLRVDRTTGKYEESRWKGSPTSDDKWVFPTNPCEAPGVPVGCTAPLTKRTLSTTMSPIGTGPPSLPALVAPFIYLDNDKNVIPYTTASDNTAITGLSETNRRLIAFVKVTLAAQASLTDTSNPVRLESIVGIPNLGFAK